MVTSRMSPRERGEDGGRGKGGEGRIRGGMVGERMLRVRGQVGEASAATMPINNVRERERGRSDG